MIIQEVNTLALAQAAELVVGREVANAIGAAYTIIDRAMKQGYEMGRYEADGANEAQLDAAFDNGYELGKLEGLTIGHGDGQDQGYDDGYVDGVADARARPDVADDNILDIISEGAQEAINGELEVEVTFDDGGPYNETPSDGAIYAAVSARSHDPFRGNY